MKIKAYAIYAFLACFLISAPTQASTYKVDNSDKEFGEYYIGESYKIDSTVYKPQEEPEGYKDKGQAICFPDKIEDKRTSNGAKFSHSYHLISHRTLPLLSVVELESVKNKSKVRAIVVERGPMNKSPRTIIQVSRTIAVNLGFVEECIGKVKLTYLKSESAILRNTENEITIGHVAGTNKENSKHHSEFDYIGRTRFQEHYQEKSLYVQVGAYTNLQNAINVYQEVAANINKMTYVRHEGDMHVVRVGPIDNGFMEANKIVDHILLDGISEDAMVIAI